jgi:hypothetical protein
MMKKIDKQQREKDFHVNKQKKKKSQNICHKGYKKCVPGVQFFIG